MFIHFSIMMIILKRKENLIKNLTTLCCNIENNLRELGYGDVAVNKKMKDLNKIYMIYYLKLIMK